MPNVPIFGLNIGYILTIVCKVSFLFQILKIMYMRPQAFYVVAVVKVLVNLEKNTFNGVLVSVKLQENDGK